MTRMLFRTIDRDDYEKTKESEGRKMSYEEFQAEMDKLMNEHKAICELPTEEFLSDKTTKRLDEIHSRVMELIHSI